MNQQTINEYALLKLSQRVDTDDFIPLDVSGTNVGEINVAFYGYPQRYYLEEKGEVEAGQYGEKAFGRVKSQDVEKGEMIHRFNAYKGMDGAPLIRVDEDGSLSIIGIHSRFNSAKKEGVARCITL